VIFEGGGAYDYCGDNSVFSVDWLRRSYLIVKKRYTPIKPNFVENQKK